MLDLSSWIHLVTHLVVFANTGLSKTNFENIISYDHNMITYHPPGAAQRSIKQRELCRKLNFRFS